MQINVSLLLSMVLCSASCAGSYTPQKTGRISIVWEGLGPAYSKDGNVFKPGIFGSGLVEAVRGVPKAEAAARVARRRGILGFALTLGGIACASIALAVETDESDALSDRGAVAVGACIAGIAAGYGTTISGFPYTHDAVNIFNDTVPVGPVTLPQGVPVQP